jgi:biotin operon repressor
LGLVLDRKILGKPRRKHWISYILQRIKKNKNFLGFISGPTGSGKSWSSLKIAEDLDPEFDETRIVFSGVELMQLINSGKLKKGSVIVFEEAGIGMSSKNWQSVINKMLNFLIQTFRHRNFILIFNSPYMDYVDSSTRKLFHAEFETQSIDEKNKVVRLKARLIQYNSKIRKFYFKMLRVITSNGIIPVDIWRVEKPSANLIKAYEIKKRAFTDKLNEKIQKELENYEKEANRDPKMDLTTHQEEVLEQLQNGLNTEQIGELLDIKPPAVRKSIRAIRRKGYDIKSVKDNKDNHKVLYYTVEKLDNART